MLVISYNGKNYAGWQKQNNQKTIQGELEYAINNIFSKNSIESIDIIGSGRTDAGVHAYGQVANFKVNTTIPIDRIPEILNSKLPKDISVVGVKEVSEEFHSRYSAHKKTYKYYIYPSRTRSPFYMERSYQVKYELDFEKMEKEIKFLEGEHDFCGFMSSGSSVKTTVRTIYSADIYKEGDLFVIEVEGNGFLYNMIRIIAGTLVDIGRGKITESLDKIIESKDRNRAGHTAPAQGLFLYKVDY
ncbi:tRNA pseudouridine(38-40) synthase TruA [Peptostreptococcus equinus]|uniref:tRNA pseudouridine synthase A n=1 Tax=Peptostreptococcus equinus TaxID=3003601 RepID=A0ABY7JR82_9FIRM|nr:tRNA pseudouridine(38-40) synthase TruA [Peptostreptococcus sp. CBA3647]WAW15882.1 tRNA pseudouridine(38-40) synthase TruA [Peptostreptococcus sp. CBA3647]